MMRRHSAKSTSSQAVKGTMAALLTSTSSLPKRETVSSTRRRTSSSFEMSTCMPAPPPGASAVQVGDDNRCTLLGQLVGDRLADALCTAGDDRDPAVQLAHGSS